MDRYSSQTQIGVSMEDGQTKITTTPVGLEPTRGDPIGLAGRRLNRSAKVSMPETHVQEIAWYGRAMTVTHSPLKGPNSLSARFKPKRAVISYAWVRPDGRCMSCKNLENFGFKFEKELDDHYSNTRMNCKYCGTGCQCKARLYLKRKEDAK